MSLIVTFKHLRTVPNYRGKTGYCSSKGRLWFKRHGLSWFDFVHNGVDAQVLLDTGCALAERLVEHARRTEEARDGQQ